MKTLDAAIERAAGKLLAHQTSQGSIHRPCAGRSIETALTLHLLSGLPGHDGERDRLRGFCQRFWDGPDDRAATRPFAAVDRAVSRAVVAAVLDRPDKGAGADSVRASWNDFGHHSGNRKALLWSILLGELDAGQRPAQGFGAERFHSAADQEWVRLMMTAVEAIDAMNRSGSASGSERELDLLAASQMADGSWKRHVLLTVTSLIAFKKAGRRDATFGRGLQFLVGQIRPDGGVPFVPDLDVWVTGLVGLALAGLPERRFALDPLARYLVENQLPSGGWSFTAGVAPADVDDTGLCLGFLERWNAAAHAEAIERARRCVLEFRNRDGGFPTYVRGAASEAEVTARGVMVMAGARQRYEPEIEAAVRWLEAAQRGDGSFGLEWTLCAHYPISQVLLALAALAPTERGREMSRRSVDYVLRQQNDDGGWGVAPGGPSECLPTSYALIGLGSAPAAPLGAIRRAADFLLERQHDDGGFASPPDAAGPRPLVYEMDLFPTLYGAWALVVAAGVSNAHQRNALPADSATNRAYNSLAT